MAYAVEIRGLSFGWRRDGPPVLRIDSLMIEPGEKVFVEGPSGSGKTTLLSLLGAVVVPQSGELQVMGRNPVALSHGGRDRFRADHVGFIFQLFNLIPYLTMVENVLLPCRFSDRRRARAVSGGGGLDQEASRLLARLGLEDPDHHREVTTLSVGQQQRVAAARALIGAPGIVIADEPTSSLDADARAGFLDLLFEECRLAGSTLIFVSHDHALGDRFDRRVALRDINRAGEA